MPENTRPGRSFKRRPDGSLEQATANLIDACGGAKVASGLPGCYVGATMLGTYSNADDRDVRNKTMPAKLVAYFESHCGQALVSQWVVFQSNHVVVELPPSGPVELTQAGFRLAKESADVFQRLIDYLEDDVITEAERRSLISEFLDVAGVCMGAINHLEGEGN